MPHTLFCLRLYNFIDKAFKHSPLYQKALFPTFSYMMSPCFLQYETAFICNMHLIAPLLEELQGPDSYIQN